MARPKKVESDELVRIVNTYFSKEAGGDPSRLKYSLIAEYAASHGMPEIKAYDFRRDAEVRKCVEELEQTVRDENGIVIQPGSAYKSLDVNGIIKVWHNQDEIRTNLTKQDAYWHTVHDAYLRHKKEAEENAEAKRKLSEECSSLRKENRELQELHAASRSEIRDLTAKNRYLGKMLRIYLYPALANEILADENQIRNPDTSATARAKEKMIDGSIPSAVDAASSEDKKILSMEDVLLGDLSNTIKGF